MKRCSRRFGADGSQCESRRGLFDRADDVSAISEGLLQESGCASPYQLSERRRLVLVRGADDSGVGPCKATSRRPIVNSCPWTDRVIRTGGFNEWWSRDNQPLGSANFAAGSAYSVGPSRCSRPGRNKIKSQILTRNHWMAKIQKRMSDQITRR